MASSERRSVIYSQNFLSSQRLVDQLLDRSTIGSDDLVYEIGPGRGLITERLAQRCRRVVAIEKDPDLVRALRHRFADSPRVAISEADFLQIHLPTAPYKVFANIPFNITTAIVTKLTTAPCPPDDAYLTVQKEAADKFRGQPRESLYAVLLKPWFEPTIVYRFRRGDFLPVPRVEIVMLRLRKRGPPLIRQADAQSFRDFVVYCFTSWRPSLHETLQPIFSPHHLTQACRTAGIDPCATPTAVCFEQWLSLFHYFQRAGTTRARHVIAGAEQRLRRQQAGLRKVHRSRHIPATRRHGSANVATAYGTPALTSHPSVNHKE